MPIDLDVPEQFLFQHSDGTGSFAVSVFGRTEAEARHRFRMMSAAERRAAAVTPIRRPERDILADFGRWIASIFGARHTA